MNKEGHKEHQQDDLAAYEEKVHMSPGEKRALHKWVAAGNSVHDRPASKYLCEECMPQEYDFLDVYRLDRELDADTKGMKPKEKEAYLKEYFGYEEPDEEQARWDEARLNTPPLVREGYIRLTRETFWMWEYICTKRLSGEATEFLKKHKDEEVPFEWEGSFPPSSPGDQWDPTRTINIS